MSNWNGNGNNNGPSLPFWKVMLVVLGALGVLYLIALAMSSEGGAP